ncbi:Stp1/IreP family PP2C-type Ser/Thr phosphatase [Paenibacillus sabuli]
MAYRSDVGRVRTVNEDRAWASLAEDGGAVAIVADGMGGHQAGDVASELAVEAFRESLASFGGKVSPDEAKARLAEALKRANGIVYDMASQNEQYHSMGTTVVAVLQQRNYAVVGHIGDSRAYLIEGGQIRQLTEDHTLVGELARSGQITPEEAAVHPRRNVLTRALGTDPQVEADVQEIAWQPGCMLLLCSDGLSNMVSDQEIVQTLEASDLDLDAKAEQLVELALQAGGDDNITVVLLLGDTVTEQEE